MEYIYKMSKQSGESDMKKGLTLERHLTTQQQQQQKNETRSKKTVHHTYPNSKQ